VRSPFAGRAVRGQARYLDDLEVAGLAHVAFVRSPYARARVLEVAAEAEGALAVITAATLAGRTRALPILPVESARLADAPHPLLAGDEVRYAGQAVAAVVAETRALAADAVERVQVSYEPLDPVVDPHGAPERLMRWRRCGGDPDAAFAAARHVVRTRHAIPRLVAVPIEPRGAIASDDGERLTLWASAQDPHRPRAGLAHVLDRPLETIHVIVPDVGGAFGSKGPLAPEAAVVAFAAIELGRPLKWIEERMENFLAAYQGRGVQTEVELALDRDGRMLALRARILADLGAYLLPSTAIPPHTMAMLMTGCYAIEHAEVEIVGARTDKVPTGPYRGAGHPEAAFALERTVDAAARALGLDPVALRRRNLIRAFPHRTPLGFSYDSGDYERCLDRALDLVEPERGADAERLVGTGVALYVERTAGQWEGAQAGVEPDGRIVVRSSASPHGQGHDITFAQIVANRLGVDPDAVELRFGDSAEVPPGVGTFGSRSTAVAGSAILLALDRLLERGRALAAELLEVSEENVAWERGRFTTADGRALTLAELASRWPPGLEASARFSSELVFASGCYAAVVEIDPATGKLTIRQLVAVDDAGRIVKPQLADGQVVGGSIQGLGAVLTEEMLYDEHGQPRSATLIDYAPLTAAEAPPVRTDFVESPTPRNPLGAKGIGEAGAIGVPAAVANAVADALGGHNIDPPFTPEKLWRSLRNFPSGQSIYPLRHQAVDATTTELDR
jgi:carbon-monoxide dehydrogenase large subunit